MRAEGQAAGEASNPEVYSSGSAFAGNLLAQAPPPPSAPGEKSGEGEACSWDPEGAFNRLWKEQAGRHLSGATAQVDGPIS